MNFRPVKSLVDAPDKTARHVEEAQQGNEATRCSRSNFSGKHLLNHGRGLLQNSDAGSDVETEHHPQQPELRRPPRAVDRDVFRGD